MTLDATVIAAIGSALLAIMTGVGLVLGGMNSSHKKRNEQLEADIAAERTAHAATRAELSVSRHETDAARDQTDAVRAAKDQEIARLEGLRRAEQLENEAEQNRLKAELRGRP